MRSSLGIAQVFALFALVILAVECDRVPGKDLRPNTQVSKTQDPFKTCA